MRWFIQDRLQGVVVCFALSMMLMAGCLYYQHLQIANLRSEVQDHKLAATLINQCMEDLLEGLSLIRPKVESLIDEKIEAKLLALNQCAGPVTEEHCLPPEPE